MILTKESQYIMYHATSDTPNHHDLGFPSLFSFIILEMNYK